MRSASPWPGTRTARTPRCSPPAPACARRPGLELRDARFKAALLLSSPPFYGERDLAAVLRGVSVPSLHVTTTEDVIRIPGYESPASDRISVFDAFGGERKALAVFAGGSHSVFTDRLGTGGGVSLNQRIKAPRASWRWRS